MTKRIHPESKAEDILKAPKIKLAKTSSEFLSKTVVSLAMVLIGIFILIYLGMALAYYIGQYSSVQTGFLIVAGVYLILLLTLLLFRKHIIAFPLFSMLINTFFKKGSFTENEMDHLKKDID